MKRLVLAVALALSASLCSAARDAPGGSDWASLIWQNDLFTGKDGGGYTNGVFGSLYNIRNGGVRLDMQAPLLTRPLLWSMPAESGSVLRAHTVGQVMSTPHDIASSEPVMNDLPYAGMLFWRSSLTAIGDETADSVSATVGMVGPVSGAEGAQRFVHKFVGAEEPKGWDYQLSNEVVFQFSRSRVWRHWIAPPTDAAGEADLLFVMDAAIGTLDSHLASGVLLRLGEGLAASHAGSVLDGSRNYAPANAGEGWNLYVGFGAAYVFNQIFVNGNTFEDSMSLPLDHTQMGAIVGWSCTWEAVSVSFSIQDAGAVTTHYPGRQRFGSLVLSWKL